MRPADAHALAAEIAEWARERDRLLGEVAVHRAWTACLRARLRPRGPVRLETTALAAPPSRRAPGDPRRRRSLSSPRALGAEAPGRAARASLPLDRGA